ncbi:MAG: hypothetical protein KGH49_03200 [Candidatus Micrarchaeota archaeon]|nr:hypothetical protein [Candidatus Micrarchaeota archaeon]
MGPKQLASEDTIPFYKSIVAFSKKYFGDVVCTYPNFWDSDKTPSEHYEFMKNVISECDLLIAEVTTPATGLGVQLEMAVEYGIPVIGLLKKGSKASSLAAGLPVMKKVIEYASTEELQKQLSDEFAHLPKKT